MQIDPIELRPLPTSLLGFARYEVQPVLGQVSLSLSLGDEPLRRTCSTIFTIIEVTSAYNMILGRPTMSTFKVVASTYHQKVKFPIDGRVGEV